LPEGLTLHSLRRTYASVLFAIGRAGPEVMEQLGHSDPRLTLRVYARDEKRRRSASAAQSARLGAIIEAQRHQTPKTPQISFDPLAVPIAENPERTETTTMEPAGLEPATSYLKSTFAAALRQERKRRESRKNKPPKGPTDGAR
jgi:hypothetical protein